MPSTTYGAVGRDSTAWQLSTRFCSPAVSGMETWLGKQGNKKKSSGRGKFTLDKRQVYVQHLSGRHCFSPPLLPGGRFFLNAGNTFLFLLASAYVALKLQLYSRSSICCSVRPYTFVAAPSRPTIACEQRMACSMLAAVQSGSAARGLGLMHLYHFADKERFHQWKV